ncbi:hypothetical protein FRC00_003837 [Tulasnella sp. 408]|nr:hypothetical protein FRC00_003837 [Tulasnella sp. 408]
MTTARFINPFMANGNIDVYLKNSSVPASDSLRLKLLEDSLNGLIYLHSFSPPICHGDIKPDNVLVTDRVEAVLCDFGLARFTDGGPSGLTTSPTIKGSTRYMSPELFKEDAVHTLSSDIWAYGCLVLQQIIMLALVQERSPDESGLQDDSLRPLLTKCWHRDSSARPSAPRCLPYLPRPRTSDLQPIETTVDPVSGAHTHSSGNDIYGGPFSRVGDSESASNIQANAEPATEGAFSNTSEAVTPNLATSSLQADPNLSEVPPEPTHSDDQLIPTSQISYIDPEDKFNELQGTFIYEAQRVRIIRGLNEIHAVKWVTPGREILYVYVKYLRYVTIMESDPHMTTRGRRRALKWQYRPILVFSWYKNGNVSQYLMARPDADRLKLLAQVASGLMFLHSESIVHGNIKPNNVVIADDGRAMLMDFGMAPDLRFVERNMEQANPGREPIGYLSPELIEEGNYTEASDVYAFASLLLEILSGQPPYYKLSNIQAMIQITKRATPSPDDHQDLPSSSPLWELMPRCWITPPEARPRIEEFTALTPNAWAAARKGDQKEKFGNA